MDLLLSLIALIVLSPLLIVVAILVRIKFGNPVIFKQKRPGLNEKIFTLYKFRTMTDARDDRGEPLPDNMRITGFGKFLRSTSIDEIPEILNIIKGDMSIVGPRPLLIEYLPYYNEEEKLRHSIQPGLTGLAQISGRNYLCWNDRLSKDIEYIKNCSFYLDVKIIFVTFLKTVRRKNIAVDTETIEPNFAKERSKNVF
jgi:undecaprenyl phosphate N,N'-diacetylbacillosamine 1-phosphate transferase